MSRHLVLGGAGFIGRHVASLLQRSGHQVVVTGRRLAPGVAGLPGPVGFMELDLATADWPSVLAGFDVIHHYAWASVPKSANEDPVADLERHVCTSVAMLEAVRRLGGKRLVFASSGGTIYGRQDRARAGEDDPARPIGAYGASKLAVETYFRMYHASGWADCRIARLANPYGPGQDGRRGQGLVTVFVQKALRGETLEIFGDGEIVRDYIAVSDAAVALVALADLEPPEATDAPTLNIGTGVGTSINQVIAMLEQQMGRALPVSRRPARGFDVPVNVLDIGRARAMLGWTPQVTLEAGMGDLLRRTRLSAEPARAAALSA